MRVMYNNTPLQKLLDDFVKITGVRIAVFNERCNEIYSCAKDVGQFCRLIRRDKRIDHKCRECDKIAFDRCRTQKEPFIYQCHLGLYEAVMPIYDDNTIIGYIMIGQIIDKAAGGSIWNHIEGILPVDHEEKAVLLPAYHTLRAMSRDEIESTVNLMYACAMYIYLKHIIEIQRASLAERAKKYIEEHYEEELSSISICRALNVGRTTLYKILKEEYGIPLTLFVQQVRINKAQELLYTTDNKIKDIAAETGFADYNYFSRLFKKVCGQTPREYRKELVNQFSSSI